MCQYKKVQSKNKLTVITVSILTDRLCKQCRLVKCHRMQHLIRPRGYKTFFMLNSAEHEIFSANKYENANNSWHFHIY